MGVTNMRLTHLTSQDFFLFIVSLNTQVVYESVAVLSIGILMLRELLVNYNPKGSLSTHLRRLSPYAVFTLALVIVLEIISMVSEL